jgi:hypothetical protein
VLTGHPASVIFRGDAVDESEDLKVTLAIWQACEVTFLRDGSSATQGFLEWLRDNFIDPVTDAVVRGLYFARSF